LLHRPPREAPTPTTAQSAIGEVALSAGAKLGVIQRALVAADERRRHRMAIATVAIAMLAACGDDSDNDAASLTSVEAVTPTQASVLREAAAVDRRMALVPDAAVGRIGDTNALVAVVPGAGNIAVYVCDGENIAQGGELGQPPTSELSRWFRGSWDGHSPATLTSGPFTLTVTGQDGTFSGELTLATGERLPFSAARATDGDGLYRVERFDSFTGEVTAGGDSIVFNGDERGAFHTVVTRCRRVLRRVVLADGTTTTIVVEICG
jgi:hypothetical protein